MAAEMQRIVGVAAEGKCFGILGQKQIAGFDRKMIEKLGQKQGGGMQKETGQKRFDSMSVNRKMIALAGQNLVQVGLVSGNEMMMQLELQEMQAKTVVA